MYYGQYPVTPYFHHYNQPVNPYSHPYTQPVNPYSRSYTQPTIPYSYPRSQQPASPNFPSVTYETVTTRSYDRMKVTTKEITVFRFPQHSSDIDRLPPTEKAKMDALAKEIADSFLLGKSPIVAFIIAGHADNDPQGDNFEMKVSIARAEAAQSWLVDKAKELVRQGGGNPSEVDLAEFSIFGFGASNLFTNVTTFPEREMNRRIVVKYAAVELDPLPDALGYAPNLARAIALVQSHLHVEPERMKRIQCTLTKLTNPGTDDTYFEWNSLSTAPGSLKGKSDQEILDIARRVIHSLRRDIANNNLYGFQVPDDIIIKTLLSWEESVRLSKNKLVEMIIATPTAVGPVHKSIARFIAKNEDNANSILSCFKGT